MRLSLKSIGDSMAARKRPEGVNRIDTWKIWWKFIHTTVGIVFLGISAVYIYEYNIANFNDYVDVIAVVPTNDEFEGDAAISYFVIADAEEKQVVSMREIMICDSGNGVGFGTVSSSDETFEIVPNNPKMLNLIRTLLAGSDELVSFIDLSHRIRRILDREPNAERNALVYNGGLPPETSQCFTKFKFIVHTPRFDIPKEFELNSYPFDYVWYFGTENTKKPLGRILPNYGDVDID